MRAPKAFGGAGIIQRMAFSAGRTIPGMRAGFPDLIRYPASFIRAKPAIGYGGGTNEIRRMVDLAGITIPKMLAVFSRL